MKVAIVGSINMDITVTADRIPAKGETLHGRDLRYVPGGKGANQAVAAARLGGDVEMFGCVGDDANGRELVENLKRQGVKTDHIRTVKGVPTGIALITVGDNDNTIIVAAGANDYVTCDYVDAVKEELKKADIVILQHEIPEDTVKYVIDFCSENGISTVLNPAPARAVPEEIVDKVSYLTPNEHEAELIFGSGYSMDEILKKYPEKLLITQGDKGVSAALSDGTVLCVPARKSRVVDTTGAGDTLNGAFALKIAEGASIKEALLFANTAAGLSTEKFGAQGGMPARNEVEEVLTL